MKVEIFKGDHFQIGVEQGRVYKKKGLNLEKISIDRELLAGQLKIYERYYPELLEQIRGTCLGGGYDKDVFLSILLTDKVKYYIKRMKLNGACTIFGIKNSNGVFVGRNLDWTPDSESAFKVYKDINSKAYSFIGISDMMIGSKNDIKNKFLFYDTTDLINEKGLFIGITFGYYDSWRYGITPQHMSQIIAERCSTVEQALTIFKNIPVATPKNFFIADKSGNMAVVEHVSKKYKVLYPKKEILIQTNHYVDTDLAKEDQVLQNEPKNSTFERYSETMNKLNSKKNSFKFNGIIDILGDTNSCVCQNKREIRTIWSLALDMKKSRFSLYTNHFGKREEHLLEI
jgi:predicted choloylglycine hydrolase